MLKLEGKLLNIVNEETQKGKRYRVLQVLTNGPRYMRLENIQDFDMKGKYDIGKDVSLFVVAQSYKDRVSFVIQGG